MKIGVIGVGIVGGAVKHGLERIGHEVIGVDPVTHPGQTIDDVLDAEIVFVCVPTPQDANGRCDIAAVRAVAEQLYDRDYKGLCVIKSTVTPGTTEHLRARLSPMRLAFCPEFLRERAAAVDFVENHDVCIAGTVTVEDALLIQSAHGNLPQHFVILTPTDAELAKYFSNVFNALRIVFANEFYEVCKALGANYNRIKSAMVKRTTISDVYLDCNERFRGFGGVCLPKDTAAFAALVKDLGLELELFQAIVDENKKFTTTVPDGMRP